MDLDDDFVSVYEMSAPTSVLWGKMSLGRDTVKDALINSFKEEGLFFFSLPVVYREKCGL